MFDNIMTFIANITEPSLPAKRVCFTFCFCGEISASHHKDDSRYFIYRPHKCHLIRAQ